LKQNGFKLYSESHSVRYFSNVMWDTVPRSSTEVLLEMVKPYFYTADALPGTQPTVLKHWRHKRPC